MPADPRRRVVRPRGVVRALVPFVLAGTTVLVPAAAHADHTLAVTSTSPSDQGSVASVSTVSVAYNGAVTAAATLRVCSANVNSCAPGQGIAGTVLPAPRSVSFLPDSAPVNNPGQTVVYTATAIATSLSDPTDTVTTTFHFTIDGKAPVLSSTLPADASYAPAAGTVSATYDERLSPTAGDSTLTLRRELAGGATVPVPGTTTFSADGRTLTLTPGTTLPDGVYDAAASVRDVVGNGPTTTTWTFHVDAVAPVATMRTPAAGEVVARVDSAANRASAAFSEPLASSSTLRLADSNGAPVPGTSAVSGSTVAFSPTEPVTGIGSYTATARGVDLAGNATTATWTFYVDNDLPPQRVSTSPADASVVAPAPTSLGATYRTALGIASTLTVYSDSARTTPAAGSAAVSTNDPTTIVWTPAAPLSDATYYARAVVRGPRTGNTAATTTDWSFQVDSTVLAVTDQLPSDGAAANPTTTVSAAYSKSLRTTDSAITVKDAAQHPVAGATVFKSPAGHPANSRIVFTPDAAFLPDGTYSVTAVVHDLTGHLLTTSWSFVVDTAAPGTPISSPAPSSTVRPPGTVTTTYDEPLDSTQSSIAVTKGGVPVLGNPVGGSVSGATVTFTPVLALTDGAYTATATIKDRAGNARTDSWGFTVSTAGPILTGVQPTSGSTVIAAPSISASFAQPLDGSSTLKVCPGTVMTCDSGASPVAGTPYFSGDHKTIVLVPGNALSDGHWTATAVGTNAIGNPTTVTWGFDVNDRTGPHPVSQAPAHQSVVQAPTQVSATFDEPLDARVLHASIEVTNTDTGLALPGTVLGTAVSGRTVTFTSLLPVPQGHYQVIADVADPVGNAGSATWTFVVDNGAAHNTAVSPAANSSGAAPSSVSASYDEVLDPSGSSLVVVGPSGTVLGVTVPSLDLHTLTFSPLLTMRGGSYMATATAKNLAGNATTTSWAFVVDAAGPVAPTVAFTRPVNASNQGAVVLAGTTEPGASVAVSVDDSSSDTSAVTGSGIADQSGRWTVTLDVHTLLDGGLTATVTPTDTAHNVGTPGSAQGTKDTVAPTTTVVAPSSVSAPLRVLLSEDGTAGADGLTLLGPDGDALGTSIDCLDAGGSSVPCAGFAVRTVQLTPDDPLATRGTYTVSMNPVGHESLTDAAGNPVATSTAPVTAPRSVPDTDPGLIQAWSRTYTSAAYGGSYVSQSTRGARLSYTFTGSSLTWYGVDGPTQGLAVVYVDGDFKGYDDAYAASTRYHVAHVLRGLGSGDHTVTFVVPGRGADGRTGRTVSVDAIRAQSVETTPIGRETWQRTPRSGAFGGYVATSETRNSFVAMRFSGTSVTWYTITSPTQGLAALYVDGRRVATVDNYSARPDTRVARRIRGLSDGVHALRLVVLGTHRPGAQGSFVSVDGFTSGG